MTKKAKEALDFACADKEFLKEMVMIADKNESDQEHRHEIAAAFAKKGIDVDAEDLYETAMSDPRFNHKLNPSSEHLTSAEVAELSDEELEKVAGGELVVITCVGIGCATGVGVASIVQNSRAGRRW